MTTVFNISTGMEGASSSEAGAAGLVPAPATGDDTKFLRGDGVWAFALPQVSSTDNGKMLQVVNGAWSVVTIPNVNGVSF